AQILPDGPAGPADGAPHAACRCSHQNPKQKHGSTSRLRRPVLHRHPQTTPLVMTTLEQLSQAVAAGKSKEAETLTQRALDEGVRLVDIVDQALVPAMASVGDKFKQNLIFVPEMLIAARAMKKAMLLLEPRLVAAGITPKFTAVLGTVEGDLHDIGKN